MDPTDPFYSSNHDAPHVYHIFTECHYAQQIPEENKELGYGPGSFIYRRCDRCDYLFNS